MNSGILNRPVTIVMFHILIIAFAIFLLSQITIELTPEIDFPRLSIVSIWRGASSEMMVRSVTSPIEEAVSSISSFKNISSTSSPNKSVIDVELNKDVDINFARLELIEKLSAIKDHLPNDVSFPTINKYVPEDYSSLQGFMSFNFYGKMNLSELQKYADNYIKPKLLNIKGIGAVNILGGAERQIYILLNREKMRSLGISIQDISSVLNIGTNQISIGAIKNGDRREFIFAGNKTYRIDQLSSLSIPLKNTSGNSIRLDNIAEIIDSISAPSSILRINGEPSVSLEVQRESRTNMISLASEINRSIKDIKNNLPKSLSVVKIFDRSSDISAEISELSNKAIFSIIIILLVILLFFRNISISIVIVFSVIFSIASGIVFLALSGIGLNVMTLAALALSLGIAIDNNIVVTDNLIRAIEIEHSNTAFSIPELKRIFYGSLKQIKLPLIAAMSTTTGALIPVIFLPDNLKSYFLQFAETSAIVLIASLIVAFTFVPVSLLYLYKSGLFKPRKPNKSLELVKNNYISLVSWMIRHRKTTISIIIWLLGVPIWLLPKDAKIPVETGISTSIQKRLSVFYNETVGSDFYEGLRPYIEYLLGGVTHLFFKQVYMGELWKFGGETCLYVNINAPQGTIINRTNEYAKQVEAIISHYKNYIKVVTTRVDGENINLTINFDDNVGRTSMPYVIKREITRFLAQTGGFNVSIHGFGPGYGYGSEVSSNFTIEVMGYNYEIVKRIAKDINGTLMKNRRVENIHIDRLPYESENNEVITYLNRQNLNQFKIKISDFLSNFEPHVSTDLNLINLIIDDESVSTAIKYNDFSNASIENLGDKTISVNSKNIQLSQLINPEVFPAMPEIERRNQQYIRYITFDFNGIQSYGDSYVDRIIQSMKLMPGYEVKKSQTFFDFGKDETVPLVLLSLFSILIVFMILASLYESYKKPFIIIFSIPMSLIGFFTIFYLADANFGRGGYASILFLLGLSVNNGTLLVDRIQDRLKNIQPDSISNRIDLIMSASAQRLRPIIITALVTMAGFLPFIINGNIYSFWYTFSLGIIGGIGMSSILILLIMPVLYELSETRKKFLQKTGKETII